MRALLYIPWFKATQFDVPLPFDLPGFGDALPIQPFGLLVAIGVLLALRVSEEFAKRSGWEPAVASDFFAHAIIMGFAGAILLNAVMYYPEDVWDMITGAQPFRMLGLSSYGGFIGAILGIFVWKRRRKLPLLPIADAAAFCFPFGWFFGRMGCFVVHDHPGKPTEFFLAVNDYRVGSPPFLPRHDLGLYEVIWSATCAGIFLALFKWKNRPPGLYVALVCLLYAPIRFFLDFLRVQNDIGGDIRYLGMTPGQYSSLLFLILGVIMLRKTLTDERPEMPEHILLDESGHNRNGGGKGGAARAKA